MNFLERFQKAIDLNTSWPDTGEEGLIRFQCFLEETFPAFHKAAERRVLSPYSLLYRWSGQGGKAASPVMLLAHYDVVPAERGKWTTDPFKAEIREENGVSYIYGRGTLDMKSMLMAILEGAEELCQKGFVPKRDVWFAFGGDEECSGIKGAMETVRLLDKEGTRFEWILDEGTIVAEDQLKGIDKPLALVAIEEKGYCSVELTVEQKPGHSSQPPKVQAAAVLARALCRIAKKPFPFRLDPAVEAFFAGAAAHSSGVLAWAMKHARLLGPLFFKIAAVSPVVAAMLRTTTAMTMLEGSAADNVMPSTVRAVLNLRLLPPWTTEKALQRLRDIVADDRVSVGVYRLATSPVPAAPGQEKMKGGGWEEITAAIGAVFPGVAVLPFLMTATTDSRHYSRVTDFIYRFSPQRLNPKELSKIHGHDERIAMANLESCRAFYLSLLGSL